MKNVATFSSARKHYLLGPPLAIVLVLTTALAFGTGSASAAPLISLRAAAPFAVLAGRSVDGVRPALVRGDVGVLAKVGGTTTNTDTTNGSSILGLNLGVNLGSLLNVGAGVNIGTATPTSSTSTSTSPLVSLLSGVMVGTVDSDNAATASAGAAATHAYQELGLVNAKALVSAQLGGRTLTPGAYVTPAAAKLDGALTLNAEGNPNAVFVIKSPSTLTTGTDSSMILEDGAQASHVFVDVPADVNVGVGSHLVGNIMTGASANLGAGSRVIGSVLAPVGAVALDANTVTLPSLTTPVSAAVAPVVAATTNATSTSPAVAASVPVSVSVGGGTASTSTSTPFLGITLPVVANVGDTLGADVPVSATIGSSGTSTSPSVGVTAPVSATLGTGTTFGAGVTAPVSVSVSTPSLPNIAGLGTTTAGTALGTTTSGTVTTPGGSIVTSKATGSGSTSTSTGSTAKASGGTGSSSSTSSASGTASASGSTIPSGAPQTGFGGMAGEVLAPLGALLVLGLAALAALMAVRSRRHATKHAATVTKF